MVVGTLSLGLELGETHAADGKSAGVAVNVRGVVFTDAALDKVSVVLVLVVVLSIGVLCSCVCAECGGLVHGRLDVGGVDVFPQLGDGVCKVAVELHLDGHLDDPCAEVVVGNGLVEAEDLVHLLCVSGLREGLGTRGEHGEGKAEEPAVALGHKVLPKHKQRLKVEDLDAEADKPLLGKGLGKHALLLQDPQERAEKVPHQLAHHLCVDHKLDCLGAPIPGNVLFVPVQRKQDLHRRRLVQEQQQPPCSIPHALPVIRKRLLHMGKHTRQHAA